MSNSGVMKTFPFARPVLALLVACLPLRAEDEIEKAFRDALYAEEVKGDTEGALKAYQEVGQKFETQRDMAATALFRQAECLRKLGRKDEAAALYNKVLAQYGDKERVARLSRENMAAPGRPASAVPAAVEQPAGMTEEEATELTRLKVLAENSPDLLDQPGPAVLLPGDRQPQNLQALDAAAAKGHSAVVAWLLTKLPNLTPERLAGPLTSACHNGHLKAVELLLDAGSDPNKGGPLVSAIQNQRLAVARVLLAQKADPNQKGPVKASNISWVLEAAGFKTPVILEQRRFGEGTPLFAAVSGDLPLEVVSELIKAGADVNAAVQVRDDAQGKFIAAPYPVTPLGAAILQRNAEKVGLLLAAKAEVNEVCNDLGATPLLVALSMRAHLQSTAAVDAATDVVIGQLAAAGADWKIQLTNGVTALHIAAKGRNSRWVEAALQAGLDVNTTDKKSYTALHYAAWGAASDSVRLLLAKGAKANSLAKDNARQFTPLFTACYGEKETPERMETLKLLLEAGGDPNLGEPVEARPLSLLLPGISASQGNAIRPESIRLLIEKGAKPAGFLAAMNWDRSQQNQPLTDEMVEVFRIAWKAAHWRDNERLAHALWLDDGEPLLRFGGAPAFAAKFCDEGPLTVVPSLRIFLRQCPDLFFNVRRDWSRATVTRVKEGKEEVITVDLPATSAKTGAGADMALQWGDVVSVPWDPQGNPDDASQVKEWCEQDATMQVRIELAGGGFVTNAAAGDPPLWTSTFPQKPHGIHPADILQKAGVPYDALGLKIMRRRVARDGTMKTDIAADGASLHGDVLMIEAPEPQAKLNEDALRSSVWLCQSMDGPFWEITPPAAVSGENVPLGFLLPALLGPHSLAVRFVDWEKALLRQWNLPGPPDGDPFAAPPPQKKWTESKLLDVWQDRRIFYGTVLILPAVHNNADGYEPPAVLREALTKALPMDWHLEKGRQPALDGYWEPRFFRAEKQGDQWRWRDLDPAKTAYPITPQLQSILNASPHTAELKWESVETWRDGAGGSRFETQDITAWLTQGDIRMKLNEAKTPAGAPSSGLPGSRRRVVLPTQNQ
jgi:ankyrin repeat protein